MIGQTIAHYRITAKLGAGGMGEVYRGRDTKLDRDVAIKVLPPTLTDNAQRLARFEREAKALAALNHLNIATIYGLAETGSGTSAIVMELVEGPTLADRLKSGPLRIEEALEIARQIADALEAAHEKGIVHRDLKPANVKAPQEGCVKVLDFGLAAVIAETDREPDDSTITMGMTEVGVVMGTPAYMSPEQASGRRVDKRTDIWAFGVVLWEMLTGKRLFSGTYADVDFSKLPAATPPVIVELLKRCLDRDVKTRLRDIGEARVAISRSGADIPAQPKGVPRWAPWTAAAALAAIVGLVALIHFRETPPEARVVRSTILPPEKATFSFSRNYGPIALSPDGRRIVFAATGEDGNSHLWIRPLDSLTAQPLQGTERGQFPFWSSDSRWVAFFADGKLKKIDTEGGPPIALADAPNSRGGSWSTNGVIVFAPNASGGLLKILSAGGGPTPATTQEPAAGVNHRFPWFLPDGEHFVFSARKTGGGMGHQVNLLVGSLGSTASKLIGESDSNVVYAEGRLLYLRGSTLMAQPFDVKALRVTGEAVPVAYEVQHFITPSAVGVFSVSSTRLLVYQTGPSAGGLQLTWFDRTGKPTGTIGEPQMFYDIKLSPNGKSLAASATDATGNVDLWTYDVSRGLPTRFTFDPAPDNFPVWSGDGQWITFNSGRGGKGHLDLYRKPANNGREELLFENGQDKYPTSWSPDGKLLMYYTGPGGPQGTELWMLPMNRERRGASLQPAPFRPAELNTDGQFSPDGRWVAYTSIESPGPEIYVVPYSRPDEKNQISLNGGVRPRWSQDEKEIFYQTLDGQLMSAELRIEGESVKRVAVRALFGGIPTGNGHLYDVSADGQRILAAVPAGSQRAAEPITLVQNWAAALKK